MLFKKGDREEEMREGGKKRRKERDRERVHSYPPHPLAFGEKKWVCFIRNVQYYRDTYEDISKVHGKWDLEDNIHSP